MFPDSRVVVVPLSGVPAPPVRLGPEYADVVVVVPFASILLVVVVLVVLVAPVVVIVLVVFALVAPMSVLFVVAAVQVALPIGAAVVVEVGIMLEFETWTFRVVELVVAASLVLDLMALVFVPFVRMLVAKGVDRFSLLKSKPEKMTVLALSMTAVVVVVDMLLVVVDVAVVSVVVVAVAEICKFPVMKNSQASGVKGKAYVYVGVPGSITEPPLSGDTMLSTGSPSSGTKPGPSRGVGGGGW